MLILILAVVVVLIVFVIPKLKDKFGGEQIVKKSEKGEIIPEGYAKAVDVDLNKWFYDSSNPDAYNDILALSELDIRQVWKYWRNNLKRKNGNRDLAEAIELTQFWGSSKEAPAKLVKKLRAMNLS